MRIGVIGVGRIGQYHASVLQSHPEVDSIVVTDTNLATAKEVGEKLKAEVADTMSSLINSVDAVAICSPTDTHASLIVEAAEAGKPTFCEKPVALDLKSTAEVVKRVNKSGTPVQIGFQRRFDPGYQAAREAVSSGSLGKIYNVRIAGHDPAPPHEGYIPGSGGIFRDLHIHDFDIIRWVLGQEVVEVYVNGVVAVHPMFGKYDDVDTTAATLVFDGGTLGVMTGGRHNPSGYDIRLELFGSVESVVVGWDARTPMRSLEPGMPGAPAKPYSFFLDRFDFAYHQEMAAFISMAQGKSPSPCSVEDALQSLRIALACDISRKEHRPVAISEIVA
jgi:myo-inositol 2-dehydrogenase/D-chiro-inositol 1-dehydrogenase